MLDDHFDEPCLQKLADHEETEHSKLAISQEELVRSNQRLLQHERDTEVSKEHQPKADKTDDVADLATKSAQMSAESAQLMEKVLSLTTMIDQMTVELAQLNEKVVALESHQHIAELDKPRQESAMSKVQQKAAQTNDDTMPAESAQLEVKVAAVDHQQKASQWADMVDEHAEGTEVVDPVAEKWDEEPKERVRKALQAVPVRTLRDLLRQAGLEAAGGRRKLADRLFPLCRDAVWSAEEESWNFMAANKG